MRASVYLTVVSLLSSLTACAGSRQVQRPPTSSSLAQVPSRSSDQSTDVVLADDAPQVKSADQVQERAELSIQDVPGELPPPAEIGTHPFEEVSNKELEEIVLRDSAELGPVSLGRTNAGALYGAIQMPSGEQWHIVNARETYGTKETIGYITHAIKRVNEKFPSTPVLNIGDISKQKGGHIAPHLSHQSGRDVDLGFYYSDDSRWYADGNAKNLDLERTWAFVRYTITETDVEMIFLDRSIQALLRTYALSIGEDATWLDEVFGGPLSERRPVVLHEKGHKSHLHVRYYNPIAQETGRRVYKALLKHNKIKPPTYYLKYKARRGDSLIRIARKNKTTVAILKKTNRLKNSRIYANRIYKIPRRGGVVQTKKLVLPARRVAVPLRPQHAASAGNALSAAER